MDRARLAGDELQDQLRDLLTLAILGDHVRWTVVGDDAAEVREWLADATSDWRAWADQLAEHLATLDIPPDGRVRALLKGLPANWVPHGWIRSDAARRLVADRLCTASTWSRHRRSNAGGEETQRMLDVISSGLEAQARTSRELAPPPPVLRPRSLERVEGA